MRMFRAHEIPLITTGTGVFSWKLGEVLVLISNGPEFYSGGEAILPVPSVYRNLSKLQRKGNLSTSELTHQLIIWCSFFLFIDGRKRSSYGWHYWPHDNGRSPCGLVGMINLGATCYMASCMQQLYMMPQARAAILNSRVSFTNPLHPCISMHILFTFPSTTTKLPTARVYAGNQARENAGNQARENAGNQFVIGFNCTSDWSRKWRELPRPIKERCKAKPKQSRMTFDTQLKMLCIKRFRMKFVSP